MRFTKRLSKKERKELADDIRGHREWQRLHHRLRYSASRRLSTIAESIDLEGIVRGRIARAKRPVRFFDSGAGHAGVSADLKRKFGDKIEITALTLLHPNVSAKSKRMAVKAAKNPRDYYPYSSTEPNLTQIGEKFAREHRKVLDGARKNAKVVDHLKVGLLEDMQVREKYDIIFDHSGPLEYSKYGKRVVAQYVKMLPRGGLLITTREIGLELAKRYPKAFETAEFTKNHAVLKRI